MASCHHLSFFTLLALSWLLLAAHAWKEIHRTCPSGCGELGNCNHELGICECPFGWRGGSTSCMHPMLFPQVCTSSMGPTLLLPTFDECFNTGTSGVCVSCCVFSSPVHMRPCKPTCCVPVPPMHVRALQAPRVKRPSSGPAVLPTTRGRRRCMGSAHPRCEPLLQGRVLQGTFLSRGC